MAIFLESTEYRALKSELSVIFSFDTLNSHLFELFWGSLCDYYLVEVHVCAFESNNGMAWRQEDVPAVVDEVHVMLSWREDLGILDNVEGSFV